MSKMINLNPKTSTNPNKKHLKTVKMCHLTTITINFKWKKKTKETPIKTTRYLLPTKINPLKIHWFKTITKSGIIPFKTTLPIKFKIILRLVSHIQITTITYN